MPRITGTRCQQTRRQPRKPTAGMHARACSRRVRRACDHCAPPRRKHAAHALEQPTRSGRGRQGARRQRRRRRRGDPAARPPRPAARSRAAPGRRGGRAPAGAPAPRPPPRPRARAAPPAPAPAPARRAPPFGALWRHSGPGGACAACRLAQRAARPAAVRARPQARAHPRAGRRLLRRWVSAGRLPPICRCSQHRRRFASSDGMAMRRRGWRAARAPARPRRAARPAAARPRPAARRAGAARANAGRPPRRRPPRPAASPRPACAPRWAAPLALRAAPRAQRRPRGSAPSRAGRRSRQALRQRHRRRPRCAGAGRAGERGADARARGGRRRRAQHWPERLRSQAAQVGRARGAQPRGRGQQPRRVGCQRAQQRAAYACRGGEHLPRHLRLPLAACARPRNPLSVLGLQRSSGTRHAC